MNKTCTKCGETKPATAEYFVKDNRYTSGIRSTCKACNAKRARDWYGANKEKAAEASRLFRIAHPKVVAERYRKWAAANREHIAERERSRHAANPERKRARDRKWAAANKDAAAERLRRWRTANPDMNKEIKTRRRARKLNAEGAYTASDVQAQYERQKGKCHWCGKEVGNDYHADHVVPLARGGSNWPENIVVACPACNRSKGAKLPHEWPKGGRLL